MLAPLGANQPIDRVVDIVVAWLHPVVAEVNSLLGSILNMGDIARRVIGVAQLLQRPLVRFGVTGARGDQMRQPEGVAVVAVLGDDGRMVLLYSMRVRWPLAS